MLDKMGAAIAESQAALLGGRLRDLEASTRRQQELALRLRESISSPRVPFDPVSGERLPSSVAASARRVRMQSLVLGGVLKRMRRNLEALRRQIQGFELSFTYAREGNAARRLNSEPNGESCV